MLLITKPNGSTYYNFRQDKVILHLLLANVLVVTALGDYGKSEIVWVDWEAVYV